MPAASYRDFPSSLFQVCLDGLSALARNKGEAGRNEAFAGGAKVHDGKPEKGLSAILVARTSKTSQRQLTRAWGGGGREDLKTNLKRLSKPKKQV